MKESSRQAACGFRLTSELLSNGRTVVGPKPSSDCVINSDVWGLEMFSIGLPVFPIKLTIGKEKKEDAPLAAPVAAPVAQSQLGLDGGDVAIMCVTVIAILAIIAILVMAMRHQPLR